jgi:phosphoribosylglycinamide formyltransferase-1
VIEHNSLGCEHLIKLYDLDVGIILGARILKENIINLFKRGVINMHPGILPENRGLENIAKAKRNGWEQGVTTHWIDKYVDAGTIIDRKTIPMVSDDTLKDIHIKITNLEQKMMVETLNGLQ